MEAKHPSREYQVVFPPVQVKQKQFETLEVGEIVTLGSDAHTLLLVDVSEVVARLKIMPQGEHYALWVEALYSEGEKVEPQKGYYRLDFVLGRVALKSLSPGVFLDFSELKGSDHFENIAIEINGEWVAEAALVLVNGLPALQLKGLV